MSMVDRHLVALLDLVVDVADPVLGQLRREALGPGEDLDEGAEVHAALDRPW
jgi:hypothetical protein